VAAINGGIDVGVSEQADSGLKAVHGHCDVSEAVDPEDPPGGQEPHEFLSRSAAARRTSKPGHVVVDMQGKNAHELERGRRKPGGPASSRACGDGRVGPPSRVTRDRAGHGAPAPPEMAGDERREHPPGGTALDCRADVSDDPDAHQALFAGQRAMEMVVDVQAISAATGARRGAIAIRVPQPSLVLAELVNVERYDGAAVEAASARLDQARLGGRGTAARSHTRSTRWIGDASNFSGARL